MPVLPLEEDVYEVIKFGGGQTSFVFSNQETMIICSTSSG